ncbi:MAG TPA: TIGR01212 family radical SAM protein [Candidatus Wirthbacteria bacterium]|nr:TIGR01212 family radical SAM protein [Candidatus Wirthbacteria bacterium]
MGIYQRSSLIVDPNQPYRDFNIYLRSLYAQRVQKIPLQAGFSCPNLDGTLSSAGCIYCSLGSAAKWTDVSLPVLDQLQLGIDLARHKYRADKFIAYFQSYTNTYAPLGCLQNAFSSVFDCPGVVGLAIGTRPDCLPDEVIAYLAELAQGHKVFLEIGLQSAHDQTLALINRGHDWACFVDTIHRVQSIRDESGLDRINGLEIVVHLILGLPGEDSAMMLETAKKVAQLGVEGVKLHLLHVIKDTALADMYAREEFELLQMDEYVDLVCQVIRIFPSQTVWHRLTGETSSELLIGPKWCLNKQLVLNKIKEKLDWKL